MTDELLQLAGGGAIAVLVLKEVFSFVRWAMSRKANGGATAQNLLVQSIADLASEVRALHLVQMKTVTCIDRIGVRVEAMSDACARIESLQRSVIGG